MPHKEAGVNVRFFKDDVVHGIMSKEAGREVTISKDFVEIRIAGQEKDVYVGPANVEMQRRFPDEYAAFVSGAAPDRAGTPVRRWPQLTQNQVRNLEHHAIYTVEDMAACSDVNLQNLGLGARKLREDAQKFLSLAQAAAEVAQLDEIREQMGAMSAQMKQITDANAAKDAEIAELRAKLEGKKRKGPEPAE